MFKWLILILSIQSLTVFSFDYQQILETETCEACHEIIYNKIYPQFHKDQKAGEGVVIEYFTGVYDGSAGSLATIKFLKEIMAKDLAESEKFAFEQTTLGRNKDRMLNNQDIQNLKGEFAKFSPKEHTRVIPEYFLNARGRSPDSAGAARILFTLVRGSLLAGGITWGMYLSGEDEKFDTKTFATLALAPSIASAAFTYWNTYFGAKFTDESWAEWVIKSDSPVANMLRESFGYSRARFVNEAKLYEGHLRKLYDSRLSPDTESFEDFVKHTISQYADARERAKIKSLGKIQELLMWWIAEFGVISGTMLLPHEIFDTPNQTGSFFRFMGEGASGATAGLIAQGPGDLAINKHKYLKIEQLKQDLLQGRKALDPTEKASLLIEIEQVLDRKSGKLINANSHPLLRNLENWAKFKAIGFSFASMLGLVLEKLKIPFARTLLIGGSAAGAIYYGWVDGKFSKDTMTDTYRKFAEVLKNPSAKYNALLIKRSCEVLFMEPQFLTFVKSI